MSRRTLSPGIALVTPERHTSPYLELPSGYGDPLHVTMQSTHDGERLSVRATLSPPQLGLVEVWAEGHYRHSADEPSARWHYTWSLRRQGHALSADQQRRLRHSLSLQLQPLDLSTAVDELRSMTLHASRCARLAAIDSEVAELLAEKQELELLMSQR